MELYFSQDIVLDILVRIPAKDLMRLKTVCKLWYSIITDSNFVNAHFHHSRTHSQGDILLKAARHICYGLDEYVIIKKQDKNLLSIDKFDLDIPILEGRGVSVLAGCNGLLLLLGSFQHVYVCNLVTRRCTSLPPPTHPIKRIVTFALNCHWSFFYDDSIERYKVLGIFNEYVMTLILGDTKWIKTTIPIPGNIYGYRQLTPPVLAEKELHWLAYLSVPGGEDEYGDDEQYETVNYSCSLNVENMEFRASRVPTIRAKNYNMFLSSEIEGSVCFTTFFQDNLEIWALTDRINYIWTRRISIDLQPLSNLRKFWLDTCTVCLKESDNNVNSDFGLKIFIHRGEKLSCYDLKSEELRQVAKISKTLRLCRPFQFHFNSLLSCLPSKAKGKRKRETSAEDDRSNIVLPLTAVGEYNRPIANDYIELRNRKIPRRCH
ncbi:hypothetical protein IFM89_001556 [Coptis chinensis]|uniref:F-box domain-containing protein n=1 Tax=Coptis chinensis TaxID=261450 RepID=A0A835H8J4_9MAGN|nr:hypothetical protein IFM89_001556 [Coptis chinensis]